MNNNDIFFFIPPRMFLFIWRKMKEKKNLHSQDIHRHTTKNIQPQDIFEIMCGVKIKLFVYASIIYSYTIKIPPTRRGCQRKKWVFRSKLSAYCLRPHEKFKKLWIVTQMLGFFFKLDAGLQLFISFPYSIQSLFNSIQFANNQIFLLRLQKFGEANKHCSFFAEDVNFSFATQDENCSFFCPRQKLQFWERKRHEFQASIWEIAKDNRQKAQTHIRSLLCFNQLTHNVIRSN